MHVRVLRSMIAALMLVAALAGTPLASAQNGSTTITVLQTSDLHTNALGWDYYTGKPAEWGLAKVATLIKQQRAADPQALLIDSGDTIQGTPLGYYYAVVDKNAPHPMALAMSALHYDAAALGNHEFNYGLDTLNRFITQSNFPVLSANTRKTDGSEAYTPYIIKEVKGVKVGILGLTTPAIPNWEKPENIVGLRFDNPVEVAKQYVPKMRAAGADVVIVTEHSGWEKAPQDTSKPENWLSDPSTWQDTGSIPGENVSIALAQEVPGIDVILAGHAHLNVPKTVINNVLLLEPSYWGRALGKVTLQVEKSGKHWQVVAKDSTTLSVAGVAPDQQITDLVYPYHGQTLQYISTPVGTASGAFPGGAQGRYADGPLADLINTVQSDAAAAAGYPVDISIAALFVDSGQIPAGQITLRDVYSTYIYDNTLYVMEINGDILRRALEADANYFQQLDPNNLPADPKGVLAPNARDYAYDIYTGIDYTLDLTKPAGQRVTKLQWKGQDVSPQQTFRVAINNYRSTGGAGFPMFKEGTRIWASTNEVRDLMAAYVQARGTIDPQTVNVRNYTLVPDLGAHYFGTASAPAPAPSAPAPVAKPNVPAPAPASNAPAPAPMPNMGVPRPASLPNTGGTDAPFGWLAGLSLAAVGGGVVARRRARR